MEDHVRTVGKLLLGLGILFAILPPLVLGWAGGIDGLLLLNDPLETDHGLGTIPVSRLLAAAYLALSTALSIPLLIAGLAIPRLHGWARLMGMIAGGVAILHVPIGSAIGIYALWVLNDEATELLFRRAPVSAGRP